MGGSRTGADSAVRGIQFANHQGSDAAHFIRRAGTFDKGLVVRTHGGPVCAVELRIVVILIQDSPGFGEHFLLFLIKINIEFGCDRQRPDHTGVERHDADAPGIEKKHFFTVRGKLRAGFAASG